MHSILNLGIFEHLNIFLERSGKECVIETSVKKGKKGYQRIGWARITKISVRKMRLDAIDKSDPFAKKNIFRGGKGRSGILYI